MHDERYEDGLGRAARWRRRLARAVRWQWKGWRRQRRTILVEVRWRLGDEIMALPVYEALARRHPRDMILAWVNYPELLVQHPAAAPVDEPPSIADRYLFLRNDARNVPRGWQYAALAGLPALREHPHLYGDDLPAPFGLGSGYVAVSAGAGWQPKRWPHEHWQTVIDALEQAGNRVVVLGASGEYPGAGMDLSGQTSVSEASRVLRHARLFIGCDSGLMHLALASGCTALCLFGPTRPEMLVPGHPRLHSIDNARPCKGCWNLSLEMTEPGVCPRGIPCCLETITPEAVLSEARRLLADAP